MMLQCGFMVKGYKKLLSAPALGPHTLSVVCRASSTASATR